MHTGPLLCLCCLLQPLLAAAAPSTALGVAAITFQADYAATFGGGATSASPSVTAFAARLLSLLTAGPAAPIQPSGLLSIAVVPGSIVADIICANQSQCDAITSFVQRAPAFCVDVGGSLTAVCTAGLASDAAASSSASAASSGPSVSAIAFGVSGLLCFAMVALGFVLLKKRQEHEATMADLGRQLSHSSLLVVQPSIAQHVRSAVSQQPPRPHSLGSESVDHNPTGREPYMSMRLRTAPVGQPHIRSAPEMPVVAGPTGLPSLPRNTSSATPIKPAHHEYDACSTTSAAASLLKRNGVLPVVAPPSPVLRPSRQNSSSSSTTTTSSRRRDSLDNLYALVRALTVELPDQQNEYHLARRVPPPPPPVEDEIAAYEMAAQERGERPDGDPHVETMQLKAEEADSPHASPVYATMKIHSSASSETDQAYDLAAAESSASPRERHNADAYDVAHPASSATSTFQSSHPYAQATHPPSPSSQRSSQRNVDGVVYEVSSSLASATAAARQLYADVSDVPLPRDDGASATSPYPPVQGSHSDAEDDGADEHDDGDDGDESGSQSTLSSVSGQAKVFHLPLSSPPVLPTRASKPRDTPPPASPGGRPIKPPRSRRNSRSNLFLPMVCETEIDADASSEAARGAGEDFEYDNINGRSSISGSS